MSLDPATTIQVAVGVVTLLGVAWSIAKNVALHQAAGKRTDESVEQVRAEVMTVRAEVVPALRKVEITLTGLEGKMSGVEGNSREALRQAAAVNARLDPVAKLVERLDERTMLIALKRTDRFRAAQGEGDNT